MSEDSRKLIRVKKRSQLNEKRSRFIPSEESIYRSQGYTRENDFINHDKILKFREIEDDEDDEYDEDEM